MATTAIPDAIEEVGPDKIIVTSFTRAAAQEIASKRSIKTGELISVNPQNVGTLHSLCYRALGEPVIAESCKKEWNEYAPKYQMTTSVKGDLDEGGELEGPGGSEGEQFLNQANILRAKMTPQEIWPANVLSFYKKWQEFKAEKNCMDFTDLIETCIDEALYAPGQPRMMFVDEAQDFTPLQHKLVRLWGEEMDSVMLVGDDDQCQPAGEMVLTTKGYKPIELLDPDRDKLCEYSQNDAVIFGLRNGGYPFEKTSRYYTGKLYRIFADTKQSISTTNHIWLVKWTEEARNKYCIYLMRKGENFRIGWCKLIRSDGSFHLGVRAHLEDAEDAWILKVVDSKQEASLYESFFAAQYGITTAMFKANSNDKHARYTQETRDRLFAMLGTYQRTRARMLLNELNLSIDYPFWSKHVAQTRRCGSTITPVRSSNLIAQLMSVPLQINQSNKVRWVAIDKVESHKAVHTKVYSIETEKYHTYIVNGIVTHNCIYRFSGADPKAFLFPDVDAKDKHILNQSYRLPRAIHNKALQIVKNINVREPKEYYPRDFEGAVTYHSDTWKNPECAVSQALEYIKQDKSVMFLATCSYMLEPLKAILRERYIPYCNPYRKKRGDWNPLLSGGRSKTTSRDLVFDFVSHGPDGNYWTVQQMLSWIKYLKVGEYGLLRKVGKAGIKALEIAVAERSEGLHTTRNVLGQLLTEEATEQALKRNFEWLTDNITGTKREVLEYPIGVYKQHGAESIAEDPKIVIGTIHSVKGGEGSVVFLFPDISYNAMVDFQSSLDAKDSIYRLMYVGATRAKEILHIMSPVSMGRGPSCAIAI